MEELSAEALVLSSWLEDCLQREQESIRDSSGYLFSSKNTIQIKKIYAYQAYCGEVKNFSALVPALNEWGEDFDEVLTLLLGGHYKACLLMLRSHFELANALAIAITSNQPTSNFFTKRLQKDRHFNPGVLKSKVGEDWCEAITTLYGELSKFTHASGTESGHRDLSPQLPPPAFYEPSLNYCLQKIDEVIDHNAGIMKVCFKDQWFKQDLLASVLGGSLRDKAAGTYVRDQTAFLFEHITLPLVKEKIRDSQERSSHK